ncbi:uncharacterized protein LOC110694469 [Chenopodium quinoa]|uniref:uncharacterized protein LOC110694469 n=1 Tax=Chenopodium quinoa TaxID=63459 RepID=UPI000B76D3D9|nr:uncharacterized protein LOC110694469 [Chenopodium quinoa]XP_021727333.1 uncharacterized protein LOC110694469 [Chenopodium quinoa]XP_021727334.1 uncharacterized protein LOC110694469 [Chenopodium quinoa]XP_021727335.1 uncharacterized protein LOC110694469 [Chenopodium quinoa]XP_021727336.1 uncharacterized protein LOC110694469 [Chenopodium quinoa]XP_021727337.1 uncharacterized protein LOC110694469 [Chenopodium quinoa]XP_021727338.1 uncharacterized protein LOC110694469 [Chenopodium quinoa]
MNKISASKKAAALLRAAIIGQKRPITDSPSKEKSKDGAPRSSPSQQPNPKVRKQTAGSTPGSTRKHLTEKKARTPQSGSKQTTVLRNTRPLRGGHQEPDLVQMAKSMVKAVPSDDRESVRGVGTLDSDSIMGLLSESLLRVHGLRRPINEKNKEATATLQVKTELEAAKKKTWSWRRRLRTFKTQVAAAKACKSCGRRA